MWVTLSSSWSEGESMSTAGTTTRVSVEARLASVIVVGLSGDRWARVLQGTGYEVSSEACPTYAQLGRHRLLVLAMAPPEPDAWDVVRHLRQRSSIPVLALVAGLSDDARWHLIGAGVNGCLDSGSTDAEFLAAVDAILVPVAMALPSDGRTRDRPNVRMASPA